MLPPNTTNSFVYCNFSSFFNFFNLSHSKKMLCATIDSAVCGALSEVLDIFIILTYRKLKHGYF